MPDRPVVRERILSAAIDRFNVQGFHGTSVRDIAEQAAVNQALISYYFGSKHKLMEQILMTFFEGYIETMESSVKAPAQHGYVFDKMIKMAWRILLYQRKHRDAARFAHREITLDTTLVREMMTTYLMKEKHLLQVLFHEAYEHGEMAAEPTDFMVLQFKELITVPFLHPQYIQEVYFRQLSDHSFLDDYLSTVAQWLSVHFQPTVVSFQELYTLARNDVISGAEDGSSHSPARSLKHDGHRNRK